ncbi:hypothetical protein V2H37_12215, partial [Avibacterium paragallinarum]|nr:hypothetical protein [Avibacterium paragallinarum]
MFLKLDKHMKLVFDLKKQNECNKEHVQSVQKLTLNKSKMMGLKGTFGLYNSDEWWKNIKNKKIKSKIISGVITDLY